MYPSRSRRPIISCTVGAESWSARATLAPVIGSPASHSQKMVWRYSSSATVAWSWDMGLSISSAAMRIDATTRALVTGASRGIGREIARALAARGAAVGLVSRSAAELDALAAELGPRAVALPADVGDRAAVSGAVERFLAEARGLDLVVANAGISHYGPLLGQDVERIEAMTRVNWLGTVFTGEIATHLHEHEKDSLPDWYHGGEGAADAGRLAAAVLRAVERDKRAIAYPGFVRLLGLNGLSPRLTDAIVRRLRGGSAAPRRD